MQIHRALVLEIFGYTCIQLKTYLWWQLHSPPIWPLALWTKNREIPKRLTLRKVGRSKKLHKYLTSFCTSLLHWYQRKVKCKYRSQLFFNYLGVGYKTYKISPFLSTLSHITNFNNFFYLNLTSHMIKQMHTQVNNDLSKVNLIATLSLMSLG